MPSSGESKKPGSDSACRQRTRMVRFDPLPPVSADGETSAIFGFGRLRGYARDTRVWRTSLQPNGEPVDSRRVSAGKHFDVTVGQIDRVSGDIQGFGHPPRAVAEKNTLYPPAYGKTPRLAHYLSPAVNPNCRIR